MTDSTERNAGRLRSVRSLGGALLLTAFAIFPVFLAGAMGVRIASELQLSASALGGAASAFYAAAAVVAVVTGRSADRLGWRRSTRVAATLTVLSCVGVALTGSWAMLALALAIGGVGHAMTMPASNVVLAQEMPVHRYGLAFGIKQTAGAVATLMAGVAVPVVALNIGWRWAYALAVLGPVSAIAVLPGRLGRGQPRGIGPGSTLGVGGQATSLFRLSLGGALGAMAMSSVSTFVVLSTVDGGIPEAAAGLLVAVASMLSLLVRVTAGWLVDRHDSDGLAGLVALLLVGAVGIGLMAVHVPAAIVPGVVLAFAAGWGWPGLFQFAVVKARIHAPGSATGIVQVGTSIGAAGGPLVIGAIVDRAGYRWAWGVTAGLVVLAAIVIHLARSAHRPERQLSLTRMT